MKLQIKLSKILSFTVLIIAAIAFVMSLGLNTDIYKLLTSVDFQENAIELGIISEPIRHIDIFDKIQPYNSLLVKLNISLIVISLLMFIFRMSRRRYYVTNYVATGIVSVAFIVLGTYNLIRLIGWLNYFNDIDFEALKTALQDMRDLGPAFAGFADGVTWSESTLFIDLNIVAQVLVIIAGLLVVGNLIWKIRLMKFEDDLLGGKYNG